jgi:hypothetical protein
MQTTVLDDFADLGGWMPVVSGRAELAISPDTGPGGPAMRLDFDFKGGGGFVVARKPLAFKLPEAYRFRFDVRGAAPANKFELKLVDPSGVNVWRFQDERFDFETGWRTLEIAHSQIEFAWGPAGGGTANEVGAIELVVAAGPGGKGTLWISALRLEDRTVYEPPSISAASSRSGHEPEKVLDARSDTSWQAVAKPAWLLIDFRHVREYGGLILRWVEPRRQRSLTIHASDEGDRWRTLYTAPRAAGGESFVYLPGGASRFLRLDLESLDGGPPPGLVSLHVQPYDFSRSINGFFQEVAGRSARGLYPRWLYREQTYWTPVDIPDGTVPGLLNEEGMLEVDRGSFSLEPFLYLDGRLRTWADGAVTQTLEQGFLPIPSSVWQLDELVLTTTAFAAGDPGDAALYVRYRLESRKARRCTASLFVAVRPFQVSPPWQGWEDIGGVSPVRAIAYRDGVLWINQDKAVLPLAPPAAVGAAAFDEGPITDYLATGDLPAAASVSDRFGYASAALRFDLDLAPGAAEEVFTAIPFITVGQDELRSRLPAETSGAEQLRKAVQQWSDILGGVRFGLPDQARDYADTCKTAIAHILVNRDGPALQPGPRRYTRSWIRDGAVMAAALLRMGRAGEARAFIRWYARFQRGDGNVPCCVDRKGPDWLPEHDSHGELIFALADYFRFTGDRRLVDDLWPNVLKAVAYLEQLRGQRLTAEYRLPDKLACFGLLPESVSHEGYLAHPVHAYWDDFWALRGLKDAAELAEVVGDRDHAARLAALRDDFRETLHASLERTMTERGVGFLPGSVEWADPDPTAVANALTLVDESHRLPAAALRETFDLFLARFRAMHGDNPVEWTNYTPYEIRIIGALVRLGRREEAHELARFFLAERRPPVWNQWPEIAWRDPHAPGHQGDLPHSWIGAEFILAFRDMFALEREADLSLVVAAGIPAAWLDAGDVAVSGLPTWYGRLDLRLRRGPGEALLLSLSGGLRLPPGGIRFAPPGGGAIREARVNGCATPDFNATEVTITLLPAEVVVMV